MAGAPRDRWLWLSEETALSVANCLRRQLEGKLGSKAKFRDILPRIALKIGQLYTAPRMIESR